MSTAVATITVADVDASIARVIQSAESIWDEWAWQVENETWLIGERWSSWDEMRRAAYGNLHSITAPRAERPELVSRFRRAGLTQKETAETLGVSQQTVSNHDEPRQSHPERSTNFGTSTPEPDDVIDAEVIEDDEPVHVNRETGEVTDEPPTCETEATPEEAYRDPDDPFGWEHTYKSFQELGKYLKKNPSPEQRERLARGLMKLHKEITA